MAIKIDLTLITKSTSTNIDGDNFYNYLVSNAINNSVIIQIPGHLTLSSSFLNSSIGKFIDVFGMNKFKSNVKISCNQNIYSQIKKYIDCYCDLASK